MAKDKNDLRNGLPGREGETLPQDQLRREQDARVSTEPEIVTPEPGKNVPEGQNTKG
jgi:hypothetical protein